MHHKKKPAALGKQHSVAKSLAKRREGGQPQEPDMPRRNHRSDVPLLLLAIFGISLPLASATVAHAEERVPTASVATPKNWKWWTGTVYGDVNGDNIPSPFFLQNRLSGIDPTTPGLKRNIETNVDYECTPDNGWELYERHITVEESASLRSAFHSKVGSLRLYVLTRLL